MAIVDIVAEVGASLKVDIFAKLRVVYLTVVGALDVAKVDAVTWAVGVVAKLSTVARVFIVAWEGIAACFEVEDGVGFDAISHVASVSDWDEAIARQWQSRPAQTARCSSLFHEFRSALFDRVI